jgi:hypothetical protein
MWQRMGDRADRRAVYGFQQSDGEQIFFGSNFDLPETIASALDVVPIRFRSSAERAAVDVQHSISPLNLDEAGGS